MHVSSGAGIVKRSSKLFPETCSQYIMNINVCLMCAVYIVLVEVVQFALRSSPALRLGSNSVL